VNKKSDRARTATPDGEIRVYSPRLIAKLEAAGCRSVIRHQNGDVSFHKTGTVRQLIAEYTAKTERRRKEWKA
jgi:hypothetical protein